MDAHAVTEAALRALEAGGLDKLTMRAVAARLDVQAGALYYHVPDKAALLRLMADRLCAAVPVEPATGDGSRDAVALCVGVRETLLGHRDAARLFAQSPLTGSRAALALMERLIGHLGARMSEATAADAADALFAYLTGYVLQEQLRDPDPTPGAPPADLAAAYPKIFAAPRGDDDAAFRAALEAIIDGFTVRRPRPSAPPL